MIRLTQKKIEDMIVEVLGEEGLKLLKYLYGRENVSEFELANKTKFDIKIIRRMLYILYNHNLVGFSRKKDKQKGWYIYYWTLLPESIKFAYIKKRVEMAALLRERLEQERKELFFVCPDNCVRLTFDQATDFDFHCPECGKLAMQDNNKQAVEELEKRLLDIEAELKVLGQKRQERKMVGKRYKTPGQKKRKTTSLKHRRKKRTPGKRG